MALSFLETLSMRALNPSEIAEKFFKRLPPKHRRQIAEKVFGLARNPEAPDSSPLHGYIGWYRADVGEYRIIYRWSSTTLHIPLIGKRNDDEVYKKFRRMLQ